jgi:uncharacterized protein (DUF2235 family)
MSKNIVVCCDGTSNEFSAVNSNVVKLYKALVCDASQIGYYHPGVGTMGARSTLTAVGKWWTKIIGLAFGYGISDNIADAYQFLMRNYQVGDNVYVFGFSRGAYTARALCGMLHIVGVLTQGNEGLIPYAIRMIKNRHIDFHVAADFKKTFSRECKPRFIGVWDTVSSVGWVYNAVRFPFTNLAHNPDPAIVRHAMSIDERRAFFRQNLFGAPQAESQDVREVWFAGVHCDVGGGYAENVSQLSKLALRWMMCEAELAGLVVDSQRKANILGAKPPNVAPDPSTTYQHESLEKWWWIAEVWPKVAHRLSADGTWRQTLRINFGRCRFVPSGAVVHESVEARLKNPNLGYKPSNLPQQRLVEEDRCSAVTTAVI